MEEKERYDVFISYRREGGQETAVLFYERLTQLGYRVAYDIESLRSGVFDDQILRIIRSCKDVIVVLGPGALDRCANPDDWVRQEVACALANKKNIVPLLLRGFAFPPPESLSEDIRDLARYNGVGASMEHFDSTFERVRGRLSARPCGRLLKRIAGGLAVALLIAGALVGYTCRDRIFPYPFTSADRQDFKAVLASVINQGGAFETLVSARDKFYTEAEGAVLADSDAAFSAAFGRLKHTLGQVRPADTRPDEAFLQTVGRTRIDRGDFSAMWDLLQMQHREMREEADMLQERFKKRHAGGKSVTAELVSSLRIYRKLVALGAEYYAVGLTSLFREVSDGALAEFREKVVPQWHMLSQHMEGEWLRDEPALNRRMETILNRTEATTDELKTRVDDSAAEVARMTSEYKEALKKRGLSEARIDEHLDKIETVAEKRTQLKDVQMRVDAKKDELFAKFAPKVTDEPGILWGKILRFLSVNMTDAALKTITVLRGKKSAEFPPEVCTVAEAFVCARGRLPFVSGVMVTMYEPPATNHAIFRLGDVIVEQDGKAVHAFKDYRAKEGSSYLVYRYDGQGNFKRLTLTMPPNQPRVAIVDLMEEPD